MTHLNRRRLLLSGLSIGLGSTAIAQAGIAQSSPQTPEASGLSLPSDPRDVIFGLDEADTEQPPSAPPASGDLTTPAIAYNRAISKRLIQCSHLGIEQFEQGQQNRGFNGSIRGLKSYTPDLDRYTQVATFQATLDLTTTLLPNLGPTAERIARKLIQPQMVYMGFALTSATDNIIVFRGTRNPKEWAANLQARQSNYAQANSARGRVHTGFLRLYDQLIAQVRQVARQLNPKVPCYIAGHSLGGAMATLATADLALTYPALKDQLQLYSYGTPRVGDRAFVQFLSAIAPNSYRIINLADIVPMVPPSRLKREQYEHMGQAWVFLDYAGGDVAATHAIARYEVAIQQQVETSQMPSFPTACSAAPATRPSS